MLMAVARDPAELVPGARACDRFRIERTLGRGATSTVYRAFDEVLGREVALKVLRGALASGTIAARRFEREARLVARLDHPAIVRLFAAGWLEARRPWLALELLEGETLEARLARTGRLPLARAIPILADVLDALEAAHEADVLHRDLKPANLMIDGERARLLDLGVGRDLAEQGPRLTTPQKVVGTLGYLAPEQLLPDADVDGRSDLWSAGVVFYRCVTGETPFGVGTPRVVARILETDPAPPTTRVPGLSPEVDAFVARALEKDPDRRWTSAAAMRDALLRLR